jgi:hypothetical protein
VQKWIKHIESKDVVEQGDKSVEISYGCWANVLKVEDEEKMHDSPLRGLVQSGSVVLLLIQRVGWDC